MANNLDGLIEWAEKQHEDALRQVDLFSSVGVRAQLVMPDGTTQDITAGVVSHQKANVDAFTRLLSALKSRGPLSTNSQTFAG